MISKEFVDALESVLNLYKNGSVNLEQAKELLHAVYLNNTSYTDYPNFNSWKVTTTTTADEFISINQK